MSQPSVSIVDRGKEKTSRLSFETPAPESALFVAAQRLGDSQSQFLGLLPYAAWSEYASEDRIICAVDRESSSDDSGPVPVSYTHLTLPTTPYV